MTPPNPKLTKLKQEHTTEAIAERLESRREHSYLGDFVLGAVDGTVTTFAIVCGVAGAGLATNVALVLGIANVLADGFSMAVSNYFRAKSDHDLLRRARHIEESHIAEHPEGEREEIRQIFKSKGFEGELLEEIIDTITADRQRWVDTMLTDELGLQLEPPEPIRAGLVTFAAFVLAGLVPLLPLLLSVGLGETGTYIASAAATAVTFTAIGYFKARVLREPVTGSIIETLLIGGVAAFLAFSAGALLEMIIGL